MYNTAQRKRREADNHLPAIRRMPGVATRISPPNVLRKKCRGKKSVSNTWSPDMFVTSPLSELAHLRSSDKVNDMRSSTPQNDSHISLGAFQLGSLRITNGIPTPEPSIRGGRRIPASSSNPSLPMQDDYFTASEGASRTSLYSDDLSDDGSITPTSEGSPAHDDEGPPTPRRLNVSRTPDIHISRARSPQPPRLTG